MNTQHKITVVLEYISLLSATAQSDYDTTDRDEIITLYSQLVDGSDINDCGDMRCIAIPGQSELFEFFDMSVIYGRINHDGNIELFFSEGDPVRRLEYAANVYPVDSQFSCAYEHNDAIILTKADAKSLNIEIEGL